MLAKLTREYQAHKRERGTRASYANASGFIDNLEGRLRALCEVAGVSDDDVVARGGSAGRAQAATRLSARSSCIATVARLRTSPSISAREQLTMQDSEDLKFRRAVRPRARRHDARD